MCGIVGTFYFNKQVNADDKYINWCLNTMQHRGPDSNGLLNFNNYTTGFVRLAIQDLSQHGNQPMTSSCGKFCITFNGEIYNANDYKLQLLNKGIQFVSTSDTEILLYTIIHFGVEFVLNNFDGMYAFAFYNVDKDELLLARDRVGIKPLYIGYNNNDSIIYGSQYNQIINYKSLQNKKINAQVLSSYMQLGFVADGDGIIEDTYLLPHGHYMIITTTGYEIKEYFATIHSASTSQNLVEDDFLASAKKQLISDVPLGTFLSGGVDSSYLTLLINKVKPITAYTISTSDEETDEKQKAEWFATQNNIQHSVKNIAELDIHQLIDEHIAAYSEPFADFSSLPSLLVSKQAKQNVTVILSGDGPDELFWGYNRNVKMIELFKKFQRGKIANFAEYVISKFNFVSKKISKQFLQASSFFEYYYNTMFILGSTKWASKICKNFNPAKPFFYKKLHKNLTIADTLSSAMNTIWNIEMNIHLQRILLKMDRASMYNSLEVRVPYLSNNIINKAQQIHWEECMSNGIGKSNIKSMLAKHVGDDFVYAPKKGFDIPMSKLIKTHIADRIKNSYTSMPAELDKLLNKTQCIKMLNNHLQQKENNANIIWATFTLIEWYKTHRNNFAA